MKEQHKDAIYAAFEETFEDAFMRMILYLDDSNAKAGLYKAMSNIVTKMLDDGRIRDTITDDSMETLCSAEKIDKF